jgi:electron transfer flavoprotein alpha subunit
MSETPVSLLVSADVPQLLIELLGKARQLADPFGWSVSVLPLGEELRLDLNTLAQAGADFVYHLNEITHLDNNPENAVATLSAVLRKIQPALVLIGATKLGMEVAPRLAERVGAGYGAGTVEVEVDSATFHCTAHCVLYTGIGLSTYQFKTQTTLLTIGQGVFKGQAVSGRKAELINLDLPVTTARMKVLEYHPKGGGSSRIEEARSVVDVGQGVKQRDDLKLIESVADLLDGQLACSRPVASDRDWFPEWLGLSGKKVSPELCLAIGISGAVQHIIGIRDSRVIVAVNSDEGAPIFNQADYGVVADLYEFLPALIKRLKDRGVRPVWS